MLPGKKYLIYTISNGDDCGYIIVKHYWSNNSRTYFFRIDISEDQTSTIIKLGVAAMANALRFLIAWPQKGAIMRNALKTMKRTRSYKNTHAIIDCSEIFISCPTNLLLRNVTYSNYKHHNTIKALIGTCITPINCNFFSLKMLGWEGFR